MPKQTPKQVHVHKLKKYKYSSGTEIFFCTLPDCHFKIDCMLMVGKKAICNICGDEFIMGDIDIKRLRPHCANCGKVMIRDADGNKRYVRKVRSKLLATSVTSEVAINSAKSLRERLDSISRNEADEDI